MLSITGAGSDMEFDGPYPLLAATQAKLAELKRFQPVELPCCSFGCSSPQQQQHSAAAARRVAAA